MKISPIKSVRAFARWVVIAALCALVFVIGLVAWQSRPSHVMKKKQAALIVGIEKRSPSRIERLLADHYSDRWGFDRSDAVEAVIDVGSQFIALVATCEDQTIEINEKRAIVTTKLVLSGKPMGPAGNEAMRRINQLTEPFVFTWEKQSFLPASWRLIQIDNAGLPTELYGYEPGDIRRAMRGE